MTARGNKPLHRKKGDWISVAKGRSNKDRYPRSHAACPWHCGAMLPTGGGALSTHLNVCRQR